MDESGSGKKQNDGQNQLPQRKSKKKGHKFRPIQRENPEVEVVFINTRKRDRQDRQSPKPSTSYSKIMTGPVPSGSDKSAEKPEMGIFIGLGAKQETPKVTQRPNNKREETKKERANNNKVAEDDDSVSTQSRAGCSKAQNIPNKGGDKTAKKRRSKQRAEDKRRAEVLKCFAIPEEDIPEDIPPEEPSPQCCKKENKKLDLSDFFKITEYHKSFLNQEFAKTHSQECTEGNETSTLPQNLKIPGVEISLLTEEPQMDHCRGKSTEQTKEMIDLNRGFIIEKIILEDHHEIHIAQGGAKQGPAVTAQMENCLPADGQDNAAGPAVTAQMENCLPADGQDNAAGPAVTAQMENCLPADGPDNAAGAAVATQMEYCLPADGPGNSEDAEKTQTTRKENEDENKEEMCKYLGKLEE